MPRAPRKAPAKAADATAQAPTVPVSLSLDVGPLRLAVEDVAWTGLSAAVGAMMRARRLILAEWPELRDEPRDLGCVPGAGPLEVSDHADYGDRRPRVGFIPAA